MPDEIPNPPPIPKELPSTSSLLTTLSDNIINLDQLTTKTGLSLLELDTLLNSDDGREILAAHRRLTRWHMRLIARRFMPHTLAHLIQLTSSDKRPDVILKACERLLTLTGLDPKKPTSTRRTTPPTPPQPDPDAVKEVLETLRHLTDEDQSPNL
jgi:hypothetical protein